VKTRRPLAILAAAAIAGLGLTALATPASANTTVTISGTWTDDSPTRWIGGSISATSVTGESFSFQHLALGIPGAVNVQGAVLLDTTDCAVTSCDVEKGETVILNIKSGAANSPIRLQVKGTGKFMEINDTDELFTVSYGSTPEPDPDPTPDSGSGGSGATPATVDVTLDQITSEVLRTWASTATVGSWKELPESSDITGVDENAGKTFLGAATTPDFPVDIAQRQVDNGWGAYETFNEDGELTSVFIPAGKPMNINGPTHLYAIWGN